MLAQIKEYFKDRGVTTSDLPKVILTHELFSVAFLAFTWAACYQIQPSQSPLFAPINKSIQDSNNAFIVKSRQSFEGLLSKAERRISHEWLSKRGIDSGRVAVSLAESTVFRKFAKPVTIPAKLWLTLKFVQGIGGMGKGEGGEDDDLDGSTSGRKGAKNPGGKRRRTQQQQQRGDAEENSGRGRAGDDAIATGRDRGWWERGPAARGGGRGGRSAAASGSTAGWGLGRSGRRRKAICPPGRMGGGAPGCFVATTPPGRCCFVPALPASSSLPRRRGGFDGVVGGEQRYGDHDMAYYVVAAVVAGMSGVVLSALGVVRIPGRVSTILTRIERVPVDTMVSGVEALEVLARQIGGDCDGDAGMGGHSAGPVRRALSWCLHKFCAAFRVVLVDREMANMEAQARQAGVGSDVAADGDDAADATPRAGEEQQQRQQERLQAGEPAWRGVLPGEHLWLTHPSGEGEISYIEHCLEQAWKGCAPLDHRTDQEGRENGSSNPPGGEDAAEEASGFPNAHEVMSDGNHRSGPADDGRTTVKPPVAPTAGVTGVFSHGTSTTQRRKRLKARDRLQKAYKSRRLQLRSTASRPPHRPKWSRPQRRQPVAAAASGTTFRATVTAEALRTGLTLEEEDRFNSEAMIAAKFLTAAAAARSAVAAAAAADDDDDTSTPADDDSYAAAIRFATLLSRSVFGGAAVGHTAITDNGEGLAHGQRAADSQIPAVPGASSTNMEREQLHPQRRLYPEPPRNRAPTAVGEAPSSAPFYWDAGRQAAALEAGAVPVASEPVDGGDASAYDGAIGISVFRCLLIVTCLAALYSASAPWIFFYDADKGEICASTVGCATTTVQLALLTAARFTGGLLYASLSVSIFSKCYATRAFLHHSWLGAILDMEPSHDMHTCFGYMTLIFSYVHGILHCARYIVACEAWIIYGTAVGRSGLVACVLFLPIVLPMKFDFFKKQKKPAKKKAKPQPGTKVSAEETWGLTYETRKSMHMLFLPALVALCFHSATFRYVGAILLVWYCLDRFYFTTRQTFLINHPAFKAVGRGTMVGLDLPSGYTFKAGSYIYVNAPTISRSEWHPFSIIPVRDKTPKAAFYAEAVGDWTKELFRLGLGTPRLPLWISAAQPSLMEKSIYYDNVLLVCTGAGITPAVSIIERFAKRKNIHLLWITRDHGNVALFEKPLRLVNSTVCVTGKPTDQTKDALGRVLLDHPRSQESFPSVRSFPTNSSYDSEGAHPRNGVDTDDPEGGRAGMSTVFERETSDDSLRGVTFARGISRDQGPSRWDLFRGNELSHGAYPLHPRDSLELLRVEEHRRRNRAEGSGGVGEAKQGGGSGNIPQNRRETLTSKVSRFSIMSTSTSKLPPPDPVTLIFKRPTIDKYLRETFTKVRKSSSPSQTERGHGGWIGRSFRRGLSFRRSETTREGQGHRPPKEILLEPAEDMMESVSGQQQQRNATQGEHAGSRRHVRMESRLPWLVLYCGANPHVEADVAKTCNELHVEWKKEYFGAW
eukprot:g11151.t1